MIPTPLWVFLDFETRSRVDLKRHGGHRYAADESTEILCGVAVLDFGDSVPARVYTWAPFPAISDKWKPTASDLTGLRLGGSSLDYVPPLLLSSSPPPPVLRAAAAGIPFVAHNAMGFDRLVWEGLGLPAAKWLDSAPRVRRRGLPGYLDGVAKVVYGARKYKGGRKVMLESSQPIRRGKRAGHFLDPDGPRLASIVRYCIKDVLLLACAWHDEGLGDPHPDDATLEAHWKIDARGLPVDVETAQGIIDAERQIKAEAVEGSPVGIRVLRSPVALRAWLLEEQGVDLPDTQKATVDEALATLPLPPEARTALEARRTVTRVTEGKAQAVLDRVCADGRLRGILTYGGAHTGRWAGRGFQPQNLPRPPKALKITADVWDDPSEAPKVAEEVGVDSATALSAMLRGIVCAPPGKTLAIVDYASVEARGLAWLAGDEAALQSFRDGLDQYKIAASTIFGVDYAAVTSEQRAVGKVAVLACGYQGGPGALQRFADSMGVQLPEGVTAESVVEGWRDSFEAVAGKWTGREWKTPEGRVVRIREGGLWRDVRGAAWVALGERPRGYRGGPAAGRCVWRRSGDHLTCQLPSGRELVYRDARVEAVEDRWGGTTKALTFTNTRGHRQSTYGGKLVENITQAVCRDLLAHALVGLEAGGLETVLHVHDEAVVELDDESRLSDVIRIMEAPPVWASGFPVVAEGYCAVRYGK